MPIQIDKFIGTVQNVSGGGLSQPLNIDRINMLRKLNLRVSGVVSGAFTLAAQGPQSLLKRITVWANGKPIKTFRGKELYLANWIDRGVEPAHAASDATILGVAHSFYCDLEVNFHSLRMAGEWVTNIPAWELKSLWLEVLWGTIADITASSVTLTSAKVDVVGYYNLGQNYHAAANMERMIQVPITATNSAQQIPLDTGNKYRYMILHAESAATPVSDDTVINAVSLIVGQTRIKDRLPWLQLQHDNKSQYGIESWPVGFGVLDFPKRTGKWGNLLDVRFQDNLKLELDVTAGTATYVYVHLVEIVPNLLN